MNSYFFAVFKGGFLRRQWYFRLVASNGQIVASSEGYKNKADCIEMCGKINPNFPVHVVD